MGTETQYPFVSSNIRCYFVKLNNPLMGTETLPSLGLLKFNTILFVKLNNPLMGTEIAHPQYVLQSRLYL